MVPEDQSQEARGNLQATDYNPITAVRNLIKPLPAAEQFGAVISVLSFTSFASSLSRSFEKDTGSIAWGQYLVSPVLALYSTLLINDVFWIKNL